VDNLIAPHPTSLALVESWLASHGVDPASVVRYSRATSWLRVELPVAQVERMLGTKYNTYFNPSTDSYVIRTLAYSLPRELHAHIEVISPTTYFGSLQAMKATSFVMPNTGSVIAAAQQLDPGDPSAVNCSSKITPACLRALYSTSSYVPSATRNNTLAIAGYLNEYANHADLQVGPST
jgi:tripeptidyl-peptidase I